MNLRIVRIVRSTVVLLVVLGLWACDPAPDPFPTHPPAPPAEPAVAEPEAGESEPEALEPEPAQIGDNPAVAEAAGGAARARTWPCSSVLSTRRSPDVTRTFTYGGPARCTMPPFFMVIGCPTAETVRTGTEASDYDRAFLYAEDGRLARVEKRDPASNEVSETFLVFYDEGAVNRIEQSRGGESVSWTSATEGSDVVVTSADGHFNFSLDREGRTVSLTRGAFPGDTSDRQSWSWRRDKLDSISHENSTGTATGETEYSHDCS
jgi:hypothetical protein